MLNRSYYFERITQRVRSPLRTLSTTSPRKLLFFINLLLALCSVCMAAFSLYLCQLLYIPNFTYGWLNWLGMAIVGLCLCAVAIVGMRGAHLVSLELLLSYFWLVAMFLAPLLLSLFACFNIFFYTRIWFRHCWELDHFLALRELFCSPASTAGNKCIAPLFSGYNSTVESWCVENFNATDCEHIRDSAISRAVNFGASIITIQSIVGLVEAVIIVASIYISQKILTSPVITQSMMDLINYFLLFPVAGCVVLTLYFWWIRGLDLPYNWLPTFFFALAVAQIVALPLGIISGKKKSRPWLSVYIGLMIIITMGFASAGSIGWTLAKVVVNDFTPSNDIVASIACRKQLPGCSGCDLSPVECDEWGAQEVLTLISLDFRLAGMVMMLSILYIVGGLIVAFLVENSLKNYKTDFI